MLSTLATQERYLRMMDADTRYLMRILPYRTVENLIDGVVIAFIDVTDLKQAEEAAHNAQVYAESIVETVHESLLVLTTDLRVRSANRSFYEAFHSTPAETEGRLLYELSDGQWNIPELRRVLTEVLPQNKSFEDFEVTHDFPTIGRRTMRLNARQVVSGPTELILLAIEDITERKQAEEALAEAKQRYRALAEAIASFGIEGRSPTGIFDCYFQRWSTYTGMTAEHSAGGGAGRPCRIRGLTGRPRPLAGGDTHQAVLRARIALAASRRRELRWHLTRARVARRRGADARTSYRTTTDIHARKQAEEASLRLAAIVESSDDAIVSKSLDGVVTSWNAAAERIFGYQAEEMIGQSILLLLPEDRHDEERLILERLRRGEHMDHFETVRRTKDGRLLDVSLTVSPLRDAHGMIIGASKIARDITERKQTRDALSRQAAELQRVNDELQQFAHIVSHDLNEPLRTMSSFITLLTRRYQGKLDTEADEYMAFVTDGAKRMQEMISDLLAYTADGWTAEIHL